MNKINKISIFENIRSDYLLKKIFNNLKENKLLNIIKYNKYIQKRIKKDINSFRDYSKIEIEVTLKLENKREFIINVLNEKDQLNYHIFLNDEEKELKRIYIIKTDNDLKKAKIIIEPEVNSFAELFKGCCIKTLNFNKGKTSDIIDMSSMFRDCDSLEEVNFNKFNAENVKDMSNMFYSCRALKKVNFGNFNANNVTNMSDMFSCCFSLEEINLSNFRANTGKIISMKNMFYFCKSLKEINLSNFNTENVTDMSYMFYRCQLLNELNLSNFKFIQVNDMNHMFNECYSLKKLNLPFVNDINKVNIEDIFLECRKLECDEWYDIIKQQNENKILYQKNNINEHVGKRICKCSKICMLF